MVMQNKALKV